jgi:hypothetical protein
MICTLKSGIIVKDCLKFKNLDYARGVIDNLRQAINRSVGFSEPAAQHIVFGTTTVATSEIAAITFKEN